MRLAEDKRMLLEVIEIVLFLLRPIWTDAYAGLKRWLKRRRGGP
jgi:hypothetical protein